MTRLSPTEVHAQKINELGLDPTALDLTSVEGIATALRRAASFQCPCSPGTLVRSVVRPLRGLVDDLDSFRLLVEDTLDCVIAHGDILEHSELTDTQAAAGGALLYAAPPSFVLRESGMAILLGVTADQLSALPDELHARVECINHIRRLHSLPNEDLREELLGLGLIELSYRNWLKAPPVLAAHQYVAAIDQHLDNTQPSRDIQGLLLLDSDRPVNYYRGRWVEPGSHTGRFVARRRQAFGADLWCYVQLRNGAPERMVDLPVTPSKWRGCDEAWQLQLAIDFLRGHPQRYRLRSLRGGLTALDFFSPLPMWARRRWDAAGEPIPSSGCLFAYRFHDAELEEELRFAREALWLGNLRAVG